MSNVPDGWNSTALGEVVTFQRGFDITRKDQSEGTVPVVSSGGVSSFHNVAAANGPGVVIGRKGTLGKVFHFNDGYWPHDTTLWVNNFKGSDAKFVYYFMSQLDVSWLDAGSANPTLNRNHLHPIKVMWPSLAEQRAIAEVLGSLDDKINANKTVVTTVDDLTNALLVDAAVWAQVAEVVEYRKLSTSPGNMRVEEVAHYSLPAFDDGQMPEISSPSQIKSSKFLIESPSVLISKLNPRFPRVWDLPALSEFPSYASTEFLVLESRFGSTSVLAAALRHPAVAGQLESKSSGTSGSHQRVNPADLMATEIPDPRALDKVRVEAIASMGRKAFDLRNESQTLASIRDTLLPQLMSGKLRVRDAEKQVEAVL